MASTRGKSTKTVKEEAAKDQKKQPDATDSKPSNLMMYAFIALAIVIIAVGLMLVMAPSEYSDAEIVGSALEKAGNAITYAEQKYDITISQSEATVTEMADSYKVSFSSSNGTFDVMLNSDLSLESVGLNGDMMSLDEFLDSDNRQMNELQTCAQLFNEQAVIPDLIASNYNASSHIRAIMTMPKAINCNGMEYPYSLEIGDGFVKTTIDGNYAQAGFAKGIVTNTMSIPETDLSAGVLVYVDVIAPQQVKLSYGLVEGNNLFFDDYNPQSFFDYNIDQVKQYPAMVYNCKDVFFGTTALAELSGNVTAGQEQTTLATLGCIYNQGVPNDICEQLGAVPNENGTISASIPMEYLFSSMQTGLDSCRPDNETVKVEVFYSLNCPECDAQRPVMDHVASLFGDHMDVTYTCIGPEEDCKKRLKSNFQ
jgi:hypothetical protein